MNLKIREAQMQKVPYMLVVGDEEMSKGTVSVRLRSEENLGPIALSSLLDRMKDDLSSRS